MVGFGPESLCGAVVDTGFLGVNIEKIIIPIKSIKNTIHAINIIRNDIMLSGAPPICAADAW